MTSSDIVKKLKGLGFRCRVFDSQNIFVEYKSKNPPNLKALFDPGVTKIGVHPVDGKVVVVNSINLRPVPTLYTPRNITRLTAKSHDNRANFLACLVDTMSVAPTPFDLQFTGSSKKTIHGVVSCIRAKTGADVCIYTGSQRKISAYVTDVKSSYMGVSMSRWLTEHIAKKVGAENGIYGVKIAPQILNRIMFHKDTIFIVGQFRDSDFSYRFDNHTININATAFTSLSQMTGNYEPVVAVRKADRAIYYNGIYPAISLKNVDIIE